jgi:hypothetical protein
MTKKQILNGNKLIAEFMDNWFDTGLEPAYTVHNHKGYEVHELQYHSSWDWFMPVVKKCLDLCDESIYGDYEILDPDVAGDHRSTICANLYTCKIINVHTSVVKFIKWYNKNK